MIVRVDDRLEAGTNIVRAVDHVILKINIVDAFAKRKAMKAEQNRSNVVKTLGSSSNTSCSILKSPIAIYFVGKS